MLDPVAHYALLHAHDQKARGFEFRCSRSIECLLLRIVMNRPVDFNDEFGLVTEKVDDKSFDRRLSPESPAIELIAPQPLPQQFLSYALRLP